MGSMQEPRASRQAEKIMATVHRARPALLRWLPILLPLLLTAAEKAFFDFYNHERPHQSPDYRTPAEEHFVLCSEPVAFV